MESLQNENESEIDSFSSDDDDKETERHDSNTKYTPKTKVKRKSFLDEEMDTPKFIMMKLLPQPVDLIDHMSIYIKHLKDMHKASKTITAKVNYIKRLLGYVSDMTKIHWREIPYDMAVLRRLPDVIENMPNTSKSSDPKLSAAAKTSALSSIKDVNPREYHTYFCEELLNFKLIKLQ